MTGSAENHKLQLGWFLNYVFFTLENWKKKFFFYKYREKSYQTYSHHLELNTGTFQSFCYVHNIFWMIEMLQVNSPFTNESTVLS